MALPPKTDDDRPGASERGVARPKPAVKRGRPRGPRKAKAALPSDTAELPMEASSHEEEPRSREEQPAPDRGDRSAGREERSEGSAPAATEKPASGSPGESAGDRPETGRAPDKPSDATSAATGGQGEAGPSEPAYFSPSHQETGPAAEPAPSSDGSRRSEGENEPPAAGPSGGQPSNAGSHRGGGQQGDWQDRNFWKRNKRKRGRHGGHWQPGPGGGPSGGGGGGGGGGSSHHHHPPQPPPPSAAPVYGDLPDPARFAEAAALDALAADIGSGPGEPLALDRIYAFNLAELTAYAREFGLAAEGAPNRRQLLTQIFERAAAERTKIVDMGYVDLNDRGAFIVHEDVNYRFYPEDPFLPESLILRYGLKRGHRVNVTVQAPRSGERCPSVVRIDRVMGLEPEAVARLTPFEELVPYYPLQRILLEAPEVQKDVSMRAVDILTPIGFGQRGLIVAPPRTGKTVLLQNIANSVSENSPDATLILLLIDERPEEVTDFKRHTRGEVVSSTFDEAPESHVHCAEMVGEKARRLVEHGEHVVILLDSITRLARAYNALASNSGKIMSGGMEATALQKPKRFFGAARNIEGAGSLTIIATALIDTGSRMDEVIFEEFKGTGNMELHLDRGLVERRIFPAINIDRSGTRKEELIYHPEELQRIYGLRRAMQGLGPIESMEMLIQRLKKTKSNAEFLLSLSRQ